MAGRGPDKEQRGEKAASGSASARPPPISAVTWETDLGVGAKVERGR